MLASVFGYSSPSTLIYLRLGCQSRQSPRLRMLGPGRSPILALIFSLLENFQQVGLCDEGCETGQHSDDLQVAILSNLPNR